MMPGQVLTLQTNTLPPHVTRSSSVAYPATDPGLAPPATVLGALTYRGTVPKSVGSVTPGASSAPSVGQGWPRGNKQ
jgi:hypothetical protein